ncbi:MAG TPA: GNAT family N-acetyltransferase [Solirubrobacterales bacterium]
MLETERLRLRRWIDADLGPFAEMNADPEVMEFFPDSLTRAESDGLVERIEAGFERDGFGLWAMEICETGEFVGFAGLNRVGFEARRSRAVMERLGMTHDPADDFEHPSLPPAHPQRRHVLYRVRKS